VVDSKRSRGAARRGAPEVRTPLDDMVRRLSHLGATRDETRALIASWDRFDVDWTPDDQARLLRATDAALTAELAAVRAEHELHTVSEDAADAAAYLRAVNAALDDAGRVVGGTIPAVLAWVDDDPVRAAAVLAFETSAHGAGRVTLLRDLHRITGSEAA
jgi:hypothetical protein